MERRGLGAVVATSGALVGRLQGLPEYGQYSLA
jgi:hypothetical protein